MRKELKLRKGDNRLQFINSVCKDILAGKELGNVTYYNGLAHSKVSSALFKEIIEEFSNHYYDLCKDFLKGFITDEREQAEQDKESKPSVDVTEMTQVQKIKFARKVLDEFVQFTKEELEDCEELWIAQTKLKEAIMWLGMDLKRLNEPNPYPNSKDPNTGDKIEPTADNLKF